MKECENTFLIFSKSIEFIWRGSHPPHTREMLNRDFENTAAKRDVDNLWSSDDKTITKKLFHQFVKEKYWVQFLVGSWDKMNNIFRNIIEERRKSSPLFKGYTDLLHSLVKAFGHGFGLTRNTFPLNPKNTKDFLELQVYEPLRVAYKRRKQIKHEMLNSQEEEESKSEQERMADDDHSNTRNQNKKMCFIKEPSLEGESSRSSISKAVKSDGKKEYTNIDVEKKYLLKKLLLQIVQFLTPKECRALYAINASPNLSWNKNFVDLFNAFVNEIAAKKDEKIDEGDDVLELIDYQHPHRAHVRQNREVLSLIKKVMPKRKLSLAERDQIIEIYQRRKNDGHFEEQDINDLIGIFSKRSDFKDARSKDIQDFIMSFLDKKRSEVFEEPPPKKILAGQKSKQKLKPMELNFTFEKVPKIPQISFRKVTSTDEQKHEVTDHYKLFVHRYRSVSDSVKGLRIFLNEIGYRPQISMMLQNFLERGNSQPLFSLELLTRKEPIEGRRVGKKKKKLRFDGPGDKKLQYCYLDGKYNYNNRYYMYDNIWREEWMDTNVTTGALPGSTSELTTNRNLNVGVVDVIHLFSKPSELRFVERKSEKTFTLEQVVRESPPKIFDESLMRQLFPMDYSYLELCEERVTDVLRIDSDESETDFGKSLERTDKEIKRKILKSHKKNRPDWNEEERKRKRHTVEPLREQQTLDESIKSCPHCIKVYYEANKERLNMLSFIEVKRDAHIAFCMTRPNKSPRPTNILDEHKKRIQFYEKYIGYLHEEQSVYDSYGKKIASDECRQFKYFIELLNYKIIYDYFPVNVLFRKFEYKSRPWAIYPDDFEFTDSRLFEQMILTNDVQPRILRRKQERGQAESRKRELSKVEQSMIFRRNEEQVKINVPPPSAKSRKKKPLYPEVDPRNAIQMEIYRDRRPKKGHTKPHGRYQQKEVERERNRMATSTKTKKCWK